MKTDTLLTILSGRITGLGAVPEPFARHGQQR